MRNDGFFPRLHGIMRGKETQRMDRLEEENRERLLKLIGRIPRRVPEGWEKRTFAAGGLLYLGFSNVCTEKLISISSQGQRVIDCETGEKTRCEENYDEEDLIACAEAAGDEVVPVAGEGGGGLRRFSRTGDGLAFAAPWWPKEQVVFMPEYASWYQCPEKCSVLFDDYELRAFGFSRCGNYMAVGSSDTLEIYKKVKQ